MMLDCAIVGGGPAGLNAALVLGRSRRVVIVFDHNRPRNAVTHRSHGFLTRDGVEPKEFRRLAHEDIAKYPSVTIKPDKVAQVIPCYPGFVIKTGNGVIFNARTVILAAGLKETLPQVPGIQDYYGKSLFSCPYCDGWELRDQPLVVISESDSVFHTARIIYNWSKDLLICTNGSSLLTKEQIRLLEGKGIAVISHRIKALAGERGKLSGVVFENNMAVGRTGGFISPYWDHYVKLGEALGCAMTASGSYMTDDFGRTSVSGIYAAGDASMAAPSQLIIAAAAGSRAAIGVNTDLTQLEFST